MAEYSQSHWIPESYRFKSILSPKPSSSPACGCICTIIETKGANGVIIDQELAQQIVDHLMGIVQRNVNIMDCNGIILASGQPERLGQFHQGGLLAAQQRYVVEIAPTETQHFLGALPGAMWPIVLRDKVIGVVGVTGKPEEVRSTAQLVKTVTELILEREMFQADYRSEHRFRSRLVKRLLSPELKAGEEELRTLAELQGYHLGLPRQVCLLRLRTEAASFVDEKLHNLAADRLHETVLRAVNESNVLQQEDLGLFYKKDVFCMLKDVRSGAAGRPLPEAAAKLLTHLQEALPAISFSIGIGGQTLGDEELWRSYQEALFAAELPGGGLRSIYEKEVLLGYLLQKSPGPGVSSLALRPLTEMLESLKDKEELLESVATLLAHNLNVSAAAEALYVHRNTLRFRLEKIKKILHLDPCRQFQDAVLCQCLLAKLRT